MFASQGSCSNAQVVEERDQVAEQVGVDDVDEEQQLVLDQVSSCLKNCQPGEIETVCVKRYHC